MGRVDLRALLSILAIAGTLRAAIVSLGPVAQRVGADLNISGAGLGLLAALPLIMFGAVSLFVSQPARRIGFDRLSVIALVTLGAGIAVRFVPEAWAIWLGTAAVGAGIGVLNVLAPAMVKRDFPSNLSLVTGLYTAVISGGAAAGIGLAAPLTLAFGGDWRVALASSLPIVVFAIVLQLTRVGKTPLPTVPKKLPTDEPSTPLWRSWLAWAVTVYMGVQSLIFYSFNQWMPAIAIDAGFTESEAGGYLSINQLVGLVASLAIAPLLQRVRDQRIITTAVSALNVIPFIGVIFAPALIPLWVPLAGVFTSVHFTIALAFIGERAATSQDATRLSGMAQSIGYLVAAIGPVLAGWLYDAAGGTPVMWFLVVASLVLGAAGLIAGQNRTIGEAR